MNANLKAKAIYAILYIYVLLVEWKDRERLVLWVNGAYYQRNNIMSSLFFYFVSKYTRSRFTDIDQNRVFIKHTNVLHL